MAGKSSPQKRRRPVGRPRGGEANHRARLLDAAAAQFARSGIQGTPLRGIAAAAGVSAAALHYYFPDRAALQEALVAERILPAVQPVLSRLLALPDEPGALVDAFVGAVADMVAAHAWLPGLWVREVLCDGGALREVLVERLLADVPARLAARVAEWQAHGALNPELDPRLFLVSLLGLTLFPAASAAVWQPMFPGGPIGADVLARHTLGLLRHGLQLAPGGPAP